MRENTYSNIIENTHGSGLDRTVSEPLPLDQGLNVTDSGSANLIKRAKGAPHYQWSGLSALRLLRRLVPRASP
jgi:hypothetical protein